MSLSQDRDTKSRENELRAGPAAAAKTFYAGGLVAIDASGNLTPGAVATTLKGAGRCEAFVDNSAGNAGDQTVQFRKGVFLFANSASTDELARADIGNSCYIVDDQTVAKTSASSTRSVAGVVDDIDAATNQVWVRFV